MDASLLQANSDPAKLILPKLRNDLTLLETNPDVLGQPRWQILDTSSNRYFSIGYAAFHMFRLWSQCDNLGGLIAKVNQETALSLDVKQGERFLLFLCQQNLVVGHSPDFIQRYLSVLGRVKIHWLKRLVHSYLFFRIPLIFPDNFLTRTYPFIRLLFKPGFFIIIGIIGVLGLIVALRQWETYINTFLDFVSLEGAGYYFASIVLAKTLHEFGHAFTAKHFGCNVPSMGIAFLVMWPILYTDGTASWQIRSKRQRLLIDSAGIIVELCLTAIAIFMWAFLPDGPLRSTCFALCTVTFISTLAVNLNFMMRFDGYYILSDMLGIDNLQTRSFVFGKWRLREAMFDIKAAPPERPTRSEYRLMLIYAYSVWVYRFFLFLGIALLVYNFFFKLLGIILFVVEILFFIILPMYREISIWIRMRSSIKWNHASQRLFLFLSIFIILLAFPWRREIVVPAILEADNLTIVNSRSPGVIESIYIKNNDRVEKDDLLVRMRSPELETALREAKLNLQHAELRERMSRLSPDYLAERSVTIAQTDRHRSSLVAIQERYEGLDVRAPSNGNVLDLDQSIKPGLWLAENQALMFVGDTSKSVVYAYIEEKDIERILQRPENQNEAMFVPNDYAWPRLNLRIHHIERSNLEALDQKSLASYHGGPINATITNDGSLIPVVSTYRMRLEPVDPSMGGRSDYSSSLLGVVRVKVKSEAPIEAIFRIVAGTLLREANL